LHASIEGDVKSLLDGKTSTELEDMQSQIESQMRSGTAKVVEYWEAILKRLHIYKAKVCQWVYKCQSIHTVIQSKTMFFFLKIRMHGFID